MTATAHSGQRAYAELVYKTSWRSEDMPLQKAACTPLPVWHSVTQKMSKFSWVTQARHWQQAWYEQITADWVLVRSVSGLGIGHKRQMADLLVLVGRDAHKAAPLALARHHQQRVQQRPDDDGAHRPPDHLHSRIMMQLPWTPECVKVWQLQGYQRQSGPQLQATTRADLPDSSLMGAFSVVLRLSPL